MGEQALPVTHQLRVYDNSIVPWRFHINTSDDTSGWVFQGFIYDPNTPSVVVVPLVIAWDSVNCVGSVTWDPSHVSTALRSDKSRNLSFIILGEVGLDAPVAFFSGTAVLSVRGPSWVQV